VLYAAVESDDPAAVADAIRKCPSAVVPGEDAGPLMVALLHGKNRAAEAIVRAAPEALRRTDDDRRTVFLQGALNGFKGPGLDMAIKLGADPFERDKDGCSALHLWIFDADPGAAAALFRAGLTADLRDAKGCTPLMLAARACRDEAVGQLLQAGADVNAMDDGGANAAAHACRHENLRVAARLIRAGGFLDLADPGVERALRNVGTPAAEDFRDAVGVQLRARVEKRMAEAQELRSAAAEAAADEMLNGLDHEITVKPLRLRRKPPGPA
jgi:hypothetical protein